MIAVVSEDNEENRMGVCLWGERIGRFIGEAGIGALIQMDYVIDFTEPSPLMYVNEIILVDWRVVEPGDLAEPREVAMLFGTENYILHARSKDKYRDIQG